MSSTLSRREMEVAVLAAEYKTNREIGSVMGFILFSPFILKLL